MKCKACNNPTNDPIGICAVCKVMGKVNGEPLPVKQKPIEQKKENGKTCITEGCERKYYAKGYCYPCYKKFIVRPKLKDRKQDKEVPTQWSKPIPTWTEVREIKPIVAETENNVIGDRATLENKSNGKCSIIGQLLYTSDQLDNQIKMAMASGKIEAHIIIDIKSRLNFVLAEMAGR